MPMSIMNTVNTPDRFSLDAYADPERNANAVYSSFSNNLGVAILNAKQLHLLRTTIPNVKLQIPDYQLVFFYYNLPNATTVPNSTHLKAVRLYPSDFVPQAGFTSFTKNIFFTDPTALAAQLTIAGAAGGDSVSYNKLWSSADVSFSYSTTTRQISFVGAGSGRFYANAGFNDPIVAAVLNNTATVIPTSVAGDGTSATYQVPSTIGIYVGASVTVTGAITAGYNGAYTVTAVSANTSFTCFNSTPFSTSFFLNGKVVSTPNQMLIYNFNSSLTNQAMLGGTSLNERLGYALSGTSVPPQSFGAAIPGVANLTGIARAAGTSVPTDSYPCLVYTQNIYLYSTLVGNQGLGNYGRKNLIAVINVDVPSFGVIQFIGSYNGGEAHPIPDEIYAVTIEMRDDNDQPYTLPLSANVNVEFAIDYGLPPYL
jgi:hypothetical protein